MSNGVQVAIPLSEHLPFDLIAIGEGGAMRRVQVRYRASPDAASLTCELGGWWADRHGNHRHAFDASAIDVLAIYCPAPKTFVYLLADELPSAVVCLRLVKAKSGQMKRTRDASQFSDPRRMFAPVAQRGEPPYSGFEPDSGRAPSETGVRQPRRALLAEMSGLRNC